MPVTEGSKRRKRETFTISFRVEAYQLMTLEKGAAAYHMSVHEYARQRLSELLERQDEARLLEETSAIRESVETLREDLALTLETILLKTTNDDPQAVRRWIDENLRQGTVGDRAGDGEG